MSGDIELPPTYYFSGITFNPSFYQSSTGNYLTLATAKSNFLTYPTAQGTETISNLLTTSIETSTPTTAFNLLSTQTGNVNIANTTTGTTGQTIKIGASTLTSVHCGSIDHKGTTINNSVAPALGDINICDLQTSGNLNIGTGTRLTTGNGGAINIGGGLSAANPINIGSVNAVVSSSPINLNTSTAASGAVNIGSTSSTTNIKGTSTLTGGVVATTGIKTAYIESTVTSTNLELAAAQIGGVLYIGTGPRTSGGEINIGTGANTSNNLYIGHKGTTVSSQVVRINTSTGLGVGSTVIGSATSGTNIIGNAGVGGNLTVTGTIIASDLITADGGLRLNAGDLITANGGLTIGGAYGITLTTTSYSPGSTQLGYCNEVTNGHTSVGITSTTLASMGSIPIGRYIVIVTYMCDTFTITTSTITLTLTPTNGTVNILLGAMGSSAATGGYINGSVTGYASITGTGTLALTGVASAGTISCKNKIKIIRIA